MDIRSFFARPTLKKTYTTSHFKHENHPQLEEMRADWQRRIQEIASSVRSSTARKKDVKAILADLFKEEKTLWSHRDLMSLN